MPVKPSSARTAHQRDRASVHRLFRNLQKILGAAARRVLAADDPEYEDVIQAALERVFAGLDERGLADDTLQGWAVVIMRNVAMDSLRLRCRERRVFLRDDGTKSASVSNAAAQEPDRVTLAREQLEQFAAALSRLPKVCARVVYMHDVLGWELTTIAEVLGVSVSAAQSRLVRGRRRITHWLKFESDRQRQW